MTISEQILGLVDYDQGRVASKVHFDPDLYRAEGKRIFGSNWMVVGHEGMIPRPGDFVTNYMGEVPVIVARARNRDINVLVNRCTHRGNQVCLFDRGNAKGFTCSYHGWSYALDGSMQGAPFEDGIYGDTLDKSSLGLPQATVASFHGLIFATLAEQPTPLEEWLSPDVKWWLENFILSLPVGGLEVMHGWHRYSSTGNWKLASENFIGDNYHVAASTHVSMIAVAGEFGAKGTPIPLEVGSGLRNAAPGSIVDIGAGGPSAAPLGVGVIHTDDAVHEGDLVTAARLGPEAVEWVKHRHATYRELTAGMSREPRSFWHGLLYPNLGLMGFASALYGRHFMLFQPRGPEDHEVWQWTMVEREAPQVVKDFAAETVIFGQHMAGLVAPDDVENMDRIVDASHASTMWDLPFHYEIRLGTDVEGGQDDLPGATVLSPSELNQRRFYRRWADDMMKEDS